MLNKDVGKPLEENEFSGNKTQSQNEQSSNNGNILIYQSLIISFLTL